MGDSPIPEIDLLRRCLVFGRDLGISGSPIVDKIQDLIDRLGAVNHGSELIALLLEYGRGGRTLSNDPLMFCLAACSNSNDEILKRAALTAMLNICKDATPTYLFSFLHFRCKICGNSGRWGRGLRSAISKYYNGYSEDPMKLALHVTKFYRRFGWSHRDVLRLAHVKSRDLRINYILAYIARGLRYADEKYPNTNGDNVLQHIKDYINAVTSARRGQYEEDGLCEQIALKQLVLQQISTQALRSAVVWETLLVLMPMKCMLRNLGKMASLDIFGYNKPAEKGVLIFLRCPEKMKDSKVHPIDVLVAHHQYCQGVSGRRRITWTPRQTIKDELEEAFFGYFRDIESTGKNYLLALDLGCKHTELVKGVYGDLNIGKYIVSLVLALHRMENNCRTVAFGTTEVVSLDIDNNSRIDNMDNIWQRGITFHSSRVSTVINHAIQRGLRVDIFVIFSGGNDTVLSQEPLQRLEAYRHRFGIDARLAFVNMMNDDLTVQRTNTDYTRDIMGFDSQVLSAIQDFVRS